MKKAAPDHEGIRLEFYRGIKAIAGFLGVHPRTAREYICKRRIPVKKDNCGKWVLCSFDYFESLKDR